VLQLAEKAGVTEAGMDGFYKVLRVMAQYDMLDEHSDKKFSSNAATSLLVRGKEPSLGHMAAHQINTPKTEAWKVLPEAVRTGQTAFMLAHGGDTMYQVRCSSTPVMHPGHSLALLLPMSFFLHQVCTEYNPDSDVLDLSLESVLYTLTLALAWSGLS